MSIYRTAALSVVPKIPGNVYRYTVINSAICPICKLPCNGYDSEYAGYGQYKKIPYGKYVHCHPLKRIVVKGRWFWKKLCPVEKIHFHCFCKKCEISWIEFSEYEFEPNYQERLL